LCVKFTEIKLIIFYLLSCSRKHSR